jgi:cytochrome c oxidase assembly protein subunit 15
MHRYAILTAFATFLLLIAGGLVTSTDSGLAVPDWPLSYGTWFPPMVGGIFYEHGHRMVAAVVGLMLLVLAVWLGKTEPRRRVRWLGYSALGAVILQAVLGGVTVLLLLPPPVSIAHACLGHTVFCLVVSLALCTSPRWQRAPSPLASVSSSDLRILSAVIAGLAFIQLVLGAVIRHTGHALHPHLMGAAALVLTTVWLVGRTLHLKDIDPTLRVHAWRLLGLLCMQIVLGVFVLTHRGEAALRTGHVAMGALVLAQTVVLVWEAFRAPLPFTSPVPAPAMSGEARG